MVACFSLLSGLIFGLLVAFYMLYILPFLFNTFSLMYKKNNNKKKEEDLESQTSLLVVDSLEG